MTEQEIVRDATLVRENNDSAAMARIIEQFTPLLRSFARKINPTNMEDAIQDGTIALWRAARDFDPSKKIRFNTYAYRTVETSMIRSFHNSRDLSHGISYGIGSFSSRAKDDEKFKTTVTPVALDAIGAKADEKDRNRTETICLTNEITRRMLNLIAFKEAERLRRCILENPVDKFTSPHVQPSLFDYANFFEIDKMEKRHRLADAKREVRRSAHFARLYLGLEGTGRRTISELADEHGLEKTTVRKMIGPYIRAIRKDSGLRSLAAA